MIRYGSSLDIYKNYRERFRVKANKQHVKIYHTPSTIDQNQDLRVYIPNLGKNDVMIPNSLKLTFDFDLKSSLNTSYIVNDLGKCLITKMTISFNGKEIQSIQDFDIWQLYNDQWLSKKQREIRVEQGIDDEGNVNKIRVKSYKAEAAGSNQDNAIAKAYGNRFSIPLSEFFELTKHLPYVNFDDRLCFELHFAPYANVIKDSGSGTTAKVPDGSYKISNIALEFDKIVDENFQMLVKQQLSNTSQPYDRVLRHRIIPLKKSDTMWNIQVNVPSESLKGLVLIFTDPGKRQSYDNNPEDFYNPLIRKVNITVEGEPNQLYSHGMEPKNMFDEAHNYFGSSTTNMSMGKFFTTGYCLFIDFRSIPDNILHGSGRKLKNTSDGVTLQIEKLADASAGPVKCYVFVLQDGELHFANSRLSLVLF